jgi:transcriptional regulator with XRE-family HTH domain
VGLVARPLRNEELGKFLMSRRVRLSAESCGLPVHHTRRRTPGLRREDVSAIAGISTAYYAWIEQGRPFDISADVLYAISAALRLSDVETSYVLLLAGKAEVPAGTPDVTPPNESIALLVNQFESGPAVVLTPWLDVLGANGIAHELTGLKPGANLARWFFCESGGRMKPVNSDDVAVALVALLRRNRARESDPHRFVELVDSLRENSHDFALLWDGHIVDSPSLLDVYFDRPGGRRCAYRAVLLSDPVASRQFVLFMTPVPKAAAADGRYGGASLNSASMTSEVPPPELPAPTPAV